MTIIGTVAAPAWMHYAACAGADPEIFFPPPSTRLHRPGQPNHRSEVACPVCICAACPVRLDCLRHALAHPELDGIWGGLTLRARRALRHRHQIPLTTTRSTTCGTEAGWHRHYRLGEQPCPPCRHAGATARRNRRRKEHA